MAQVRLERHEAEYGYLPPVCMRCGAPATCQRHKHFSKTGRSGNIVPTWLVAPFCPAHRWHWVRRRLPFPISILGFLIAGCAGFGFFLQFDAQGTVNPKALTAIIVGLLLGIGLLMVHLGAIFVAQVDVDSVRVKGVATEFVTALEQHRNSPGRDQPLALEGAENCRRQVRLFRDEVSGLPAVCVCCGEPASHRVAREYKTRIRRAASTSDLIAVLFAFMGLVYVTSEQNGAPWHVKLPACDRHRTHWRNRLLLILAGFAVPVAGVIIALAKLLPPHLVPTVGGWSIVALLVWAVISLFIYETSTKAGNASEGSLVLRGVSERFVNAVEDQRRQQGLSPGALVQAPPEGNRTDIQADQSKLPGDAYGPASP